MISGNAFTTLGSHYKRVFDAHHAHTWAEQHVPFFWSLFGFAAASAIIGLSRWFGRSGIQAPADIYDRSLTRICEDEE